MSITAKAVANLLALRPGTIGQLEALADILADNVSRFRFWQDCSATARRRFRVEIETGEQVFRVARERCHQAIAERINAGEMCLCD